MTQTKKERGERHNLAVLEVLLGSLGFLSYVHWNSIGFDTCIRHSFLSGLEPSWPLNSCKHHPFDWDEVARRIKGPSLTVEHNSEVQSHIGGTDVHGDTLVV